MKPKPTRNVLTFSRRDADGWQRVAVDGVPVGTIRSVAIGWVTRHTDGTQGPTRRDKLDAAWDLVNS